MAAKFLRKNVISGFSYARHIDIWKKTKHLATATDKSKSELLDKVSFLTHDCTVEELEAVQDLVVGNLEVHANFVSEEDERRLLGEAEPYLSRQVYQYDHWDGVSMGLNILLFWYV